MPGHHGEHNRGRKRRRDGQHQQQGREDRADSVNNTRRNSRGTPEGPPLVPPVHLPVTATGSSKFAKHKLSVEIETLKRWEAKIESNPREVFPAMPYIKGFPDFGEFRQLYLETAKELMFAGLKEVILRFFQEKREAAEGELSALEEGDQSLASLRQELAAAKKQIKSLTKKSKKLQPANPSSSLPSSSTEENAASTDSED